VNEEVLRALLRSDKIKPSETIKLLEINRVKVQPHLKLHQLVRYEKWYHECYVARVRTRSCWKQKDFDRVRYPKPLALELVRPYLRARLDSTLDDPCIFSVFMDRSIDLNVAHQDEQTPSSRQILRQDMISSIDTSLVNSAGSLFNTLFSSHELNYWLPRYDAAQLTAQPKHEDNLRLFNFFRVAYNALHAGYVGDPESPDCSEMDSDTMRDMLSHPPEDPEYARPFAIDCFNLATNSKNEWLLEDFFDSNTGMLLDISSLPERIWYVEEQGKTDLNTDFIYRALGSPPKPQEWTYRRHSLLSASL
jgi:hypothetical protein